MESGRDVNGTQRVAVRLRLPRKLFMNLDELKRY